RNFFPPVVGSSGGTNVNRFYVFGFNERPILGEGWYDLERLGDGPPFRATSGKATLILPKFDLRELVLICCAQTKITGEPLQVDLIDPRRQVTQMEISSDAWHIRRYVPPEPGQSLEYLEIFVRNPWSPNRLLGSPDRRRLGLFVSAIRLCLVEDGGKWDEWDR
nr:hypothetical protein [bacterium]